jgi:non-ribosomal peptide synthetase component E (peptide arylation enzyme)
MNIGALLPRHARYRPDHVALVVGDQRLTYRELNAIVNRLAKHSWPTASSRASKSPPF